MVQPPIDFVIITALEEEMRAVLERLSVTSQLNSTSKAYQQLDPTSDDVRTYFYAKLPVTFPSGTSAEYDIIILSLQGMGRVSAAVATSDAIKRWIPRYILLVGIAGGINKNEVALGDILISDQIVDYELQKITEEGSSVRFKVHTVDPRLLAAAQAFQISNWTSSLDKERPAAGESKRIIGPIASGDKIIAFSKMLDKHREAWPKLIGVEMEAGGTAHAAAQATFRPGFFMIRSVSDLANEQKDSPTVKGWREYACKSAAEYAIAFLQSGPITKEEKQTIPTLSPKEILPTETIPVLHYRDHCISDLNSIEVLLESGKTGVDIRYHEKVLRAISLVQSWHDNLDKNVNEIPSLSMVSGNERIKSILKFRHALELQYKALRWIQDRNYRRLPVLLGKLIDASDDNKKNALHSYATFAVLMLVRRLQTYQSEARYAGYIWERELIPDLPSIPESLLEILPNEEDLLGKLLFNEINFIECRIHDSGKDTSTSILMPIHDARSFMCSRKSLNVNYNDKIYYKWVLPQFCLNNENDTINLRSWCLYFRDSSGR